MLHILAKDEAHFKRLIRKYQKAGYEITFLEDGVAELVKGDAVVVIEI